MCSWHDGPDIRRARRARRSRARSTSRKCCASSDSGRRGAITARSERTSTAGAYRPSTLTHSARTGTLVRDMPVRSRRSSCGIRPIRGMHSSVASTRPACRDGPASCAGRGSSGAAARWRSSSTTPTGSRRTTASKTCASSVPTARRPCRRTAEGTWTRSHLGRAFVAGRRFGRGPLGSAIARWNAASVSGSPGRARISARWSVLPPL